MVPAVANRFAGTCAVSVPAFTNVVSVPAPFRAIIEFAVNPEPETVMVVGWDPSPMLLGEIDVMDGVDARPASTGMVSLFPVAGSVTTIDPEVGPPPSSLGSTVTISDAGVE